MKPVLSVTAAVLSLVAAAAHADPIAPGGTVTYTVPGTTSVYQIFGHDGSPGGGGPATDALLTTFTAGSGNVFNFNATGLINCCSGTPDTPPDGGGSSMNIVGANGLSGLIGNSSVPLVGVFTSDTDPFGGTAPAALTFDANNPTDLAPLLNQVFYIGDGHAGRNNAAGTLLNFTAPSNATRLYLGVIDAFRFDATTGYYVDNTGSYSVAAALQGGSAVPEPRTWLMMILGFGAIGLAFRSRRASGKAAGSTLASS